jgi:hypothetical protein
MPSKSKKQHNFMEAVAHSPEFAKKAGVEQKVGKEFSEADKKRGKVVLRKLPSKVSSTKQGKTWRHQGR